MRKKILIGSMLVLTLLLLMPSIPAIQQKTIEEGIKQDIQEKLDEITLDDDIKHPLLYLIFGLIINFRIIRGVLLMHLAADFDDNAPPGAWPWTVHYPLIFERGMWVCVSAVILDNFLRAISDRLGW